MEIEEERVHIHQTPPFGVSAAGLMVRAFLALALILAIVYAWRKVFERVAALRRIAEIKRNRAKKLL